MKIHFFATAIISTIFITSCNKEDKLIPIQKPVKLTNEIVAPTGFTWENSRNINFTINVFNSKSPNNIHVITIYNDDPKTGGTQITKGSATTTEAFKSKIYLPNHVLDVFVVGVFPNGSVITKKITITKPDVSITLGT